MIVNRQFLLLVLLVAFFRLSLAKEPEISLQWAICERDASTALSKLNYLDKSPYKANPISYYDTWPPEYTRRGIAFRTKVKKHDPGWPISMLKARFGECNENVPSAADCTWTRYGNDTTYTCGLSNVLSEIGGAEGENVWSEEQVAFAQRYQNIAWKELVPFGPYINPKWKLHILGAKAVFDDVQALPLHLMEMEINVKKSKGEEFYDQVSALLKEKGVTLCDEQLPKTLRLLDYLEDRAVRDDAGSQQIVLDQ